jgi:hypothetical protein
MVTADAGPIVDSLIHCETQPMSPPGRKRKIGAQKNGDKSAFTCAICKRQFQPLQTASKETIYSICPDCRTTA